MKTQSIEVLRKQLKSLDRSNFTFTKSAELGGNQDVPFEQAFSNLAHAYLKDKAPGLQAYEVGFQLIDRNQENTKAVGVFGFKVGSQWLYAPVFFLNGDLKGHELLYIKNQDLFVPMKENWLNYLLNRRPNVLGEGVDRDLSAKGVTSPNLYQLSRSPAKYASANVASWATDVLPDFAHFATSDPLQDEKYKDLRTSLDFIKDAGKEGVNLLVDIVTEYPAMRDTLNKIYGQDKLDSAVKEAGHNSRMRDNVLKPITTQAKTASITDVLFREEKEAEEKNKKVKNSVRVVTYKKVLEVPSIGAELDDKDKKTLQSGNVVIKDDREDKDITIAYNIQVRQHLQSPDSTGLYEVLTRPGEFKKCLVIFGPYANCGRKIFCTVVDIENKSWVSTHPSQIWTKSKYEREVYDKWFKELKDTESLSEGRGLKLLIGATGQGTLPFRVYNSNGGELKSYDVLFKHHAQRKRPISWPYERHAPDPISGQQSHDRIVMTGTPGKSLKAMGSELLVPDNYKTISLDQQDECGCGNDSDPAAILDLCTASAFQMGIIKSGILKNMDITHNGSFVKINSHKEMSPTNALIYLVKDAGFREAQAQELLDIARDRKKFSFLVKYAAPYNLTDQGPSAPSMPEPSLGMDPMTGGQVPTMNKFEHHMPVPGMGAKDYDRSGYDPRPSATHQHYTVDDSPKPDPKALESAQHAGESGQKEVFDTAILGSLLKAVRSDSMIDRYMGDLMKGMDRLARILFMFYWHQDEFEERYGKQHIPEFEDGARNAFEAMGDIVLWLKQKKIEPHPDELQNVDLKSIAGS